MFIAHFYQLTKRIHTMMDRNKEISEVRVCTVAIPDNTSGLKLKSLIRMEAEAYQLSAIPNSVIYLAILVPVHLRMVMSPKEWDRLTKKLTDRYENIFDMTIITVPAGLTKEAAEAMTKEATRKLLTAIQKHNGIEPDIDDDDLTFTTSYDPPEPAANGSMPMTIKHSILNIELGLSEEELKAKFVDFAKDVEDRHGGTSTAFFVTVYLPNMYVPLFDKGSTLDKLLSDIVCEKENIHNINIINVDGPLNAKELLEATQKIHQDMSQIIADASSQT